MAGDRTWALKGVSDETRDAAREVAHEAGLPIGAWVDRALAGAVEEARNPRPPAATRAEVADAVREALGERLVPLAERLSSLEEMASRQTRPEPEPAGEAVPAAATSVEAVRARLRRRRGL